MTDTPAHTPLPWSITRAPSGRPYSIHSLSPEDWTSFDAAHHVFQWLQDAGFQIVSAAFAEREARLVGALGEARRIITEIDDYMMRPERGDWGTECALCMGELLDDDRDALARIDTALSQAGGASE